MLVWLLDVQAILDMDMPAGSQAAWQTRCRPLAEMQLDQTAPCRLQAVQLLAAWQLWTVELEVEQVVAWKP